MRKAVVPALGVATMAAALGVSGPHASAGQAHATGQTHVTSQAIAASKNIVTLTIHWEQQKKGYWCGPTAARMALKTWVKNPASQSTLADDMISDWPHDPHTSDATKATKAMNNALSRSGFGKPYFTRGFKKNTPLYKKRAQLFKDVRVTVGSKRHAMVIHIRSNKKKKFHPNYPNRYVGHYVTIIGFNLQAGTILITDPASGYNKDWSKVPKRYWVSANRLATAMATGNDNHYYSTMS
ncbi:C39 family peptidase [Actinomadura rudentiformis]|uniref:Peptidase C39-like domain-containing protein n=1 Tax=Actinomadura rudentiformis TaxID=359158 RepID=A0A6H9Z2W6_9ACTN|nr:C39 family peptidase [Actinomadura rudentiformis]KAB2350063.1 hypothetical protein F8566_09590 [Actinomadura rudentiformis]